MIQMNKSNFINRFKDSNKVLC